MLRARLAARLANGLDRHARTTVAALATIEAMTATRPREMAAWLRDYFPEIAPADWHWDRSTCWVAFMMTREAEHNPPFYWLGRALDVAAAHGASDTFRDRLLAAHGASECQGGSAEDQRAQDVLSEACGYAWTVQHLGKPRLLDSQHGLLLTVDAHSTTVAVRRFRPVQRMDQLLELVAEYTGEATIDLPADGGRILYVDAFHEQGYAHSVGYHLDLTEPVEDLLKDLAAEAQLGYVLTRPFQWGNPVASWY